MKKILDLINKNRIFIILVLIISITTVFIYELLKIKPPVDDKDLYINSSVELKSEELDDNKKINIDGREKKKIKIELKNNFSNDKKVFVWYKSDNDKVMVGNLSTSEIKLCKEGLIIEHNKIIEIEIGIKNNSDMIGEIEFGIINKDLDEDIDDGNYKFIDEVFNINNNKKYSIGNKVVLNDNSSWHVIEESDDADIYVSLLSDDILKVDNNDSIDAKKNMVLFNVNDENIGFYLDNDYRRILDDKNVKIGENGEIRLITLEELQKLAEYSYKNYNYYGKNIPGWLNIKKPWWTMTPYSKKGHYYVDGKNIIATKDEKKTRAGLRVVLKILKSNIK